VCFGNHKSKREAVTAALVAYVRARKRSGFRDLIGAVDFHDEFDHRLLRRRRTAKGR
jgi:hypothetical protein